MFISKLLKSIAVCTLSASVLTGPALALSKKSELPKDAKPLSDAVIAKQNIGKTIKGKWWYPDGKYGGKWSTTFTGGPTEGVKKLAGRKKPGRWTFKNGDWCSTEGRNQKMKCDTVSYKHDGMCYIFYPNGNKSSERKC